MVRWDVTTPTGICHFHLSRSERGWVVSEDATTPPAAMIALSMADLAALVAGRLDGMDAFLKGHIRLSGDLALARLLLSPS